MAIFDVVDEEGVEFAPRLDLRQAVEEHEGTESIVAAIKNLDMIIIERDTFQELVDQHHK